MYHPPNCYALPDGSGSIVKIGCQVSGDGGEWLPHVVQIGPGQYVAAVCRNAPGVQVVGFEPIWTDPAIAMHQADKMAFIAASPQAILTAQPLPVPGLPWRRP